MEIKWKTYSHIYHPYGDLIWHLFWGVVIGATLVWAISARDFWLLVVSFLALIFFFHPKFYEPKLMEIKMNEKGIFIDKKFYPWEKFHGFEIFSNELRKFVFLFPNKISLGLHFPLEEFFVSEEEVRNFMKKFLEEYQGKVPFLDRLYRSFYL